MSKLATLIVLGVCLQAQSAKADRTYYLSMGGVGSVIFARSGTQILPIATSLNIGMANTVSGKWGWYTGFGVTMSGVPFEPNIFTGPTYSITDKLMLGVDVNYQVTPPTGGAALAHRLGGECYLLAALNKTASLGLAVSYNASPGMKDDVGVVSVVPFINVPLPF